MHFLVSQKLVLCGLDVLLLFAKLKPFTIPVICFWKYAGACASPKGTLMYSYFPNSEVKAVLGWMFHLKEYGGILIEGPMWRNILHHLAERKYFPL